MTDSSGDSEAFRAQARAWFAENFPPALKGRWDLSYVEEERPSDPDYRVWSTVMGERGWGTPTWPKAYGGGGLTPAEAGVLSQEMDRIGAWNPISGLGVMMFGPTLLEFGTEAQKQRHIPQIATNAVRWCQGFSEPGAGSDLASLGTRCDDMGDHFVVNGSKVWTSGAQWADWCFCLVRTDRTRKHEGISFLLIDMTSPGVDVRPIKLISGPSPFCETFFTDVKVPKDNLVGPLNGGWTIAKRLLQHERSGIGGGSAGGLASPSNLFGVVGSPVALARLYIGADEDGRILDPDLRGRITVNEMALHAVQLTASRSAAEGSAQQGPSTATSIMKNAATKPLQDRDELIIEIMGSQGLGWAGDEFKPEEIEAVRGWLGGKATTIFGGSYEIQNNIISKRILGLPDLLSPPTP